ncbi:MAG: hypothetical protein R3C28_06970 [Pirellulaceae bacterium]
MSERPEYATVWLNDELYFAADDGTGDVELWKSDGTPNGTQRVADIRAGSLSSFPEHLVAASDRIYFTAFEDETGRELWVTDGTETGTRRVSNFPGNVAEDYRNYQAVAIDDRLYFTWSTPDYGNEIWVTDGTEAGTTLLTDSIPGPEGTWGLRITKLGDQLLFTANNRLWVSDGTAAGTHELVDESFGLSFPRIYATTSDHAFFFSRQELVPGSISQSFWSTDGTAAGTIELISDFQYAPVAVAGKEVIFFSHCQRQELIGSLATSEIIRSDGTIAGTERIEFTGCVIGEPVAVEDRVYMVVDQRKTASIGGYETIESGQVWTITAGQSEVMRVPDIPQVWQTYRAEIAATDSSVYVSTVDGIHQLSRNATNNVAFPGVEDEIELSGVTESASGKTLMWTALPDRHVLWAIDRATQTATPITDQLLRPTRNGPPGQILGVGDGVIAQYFNDDYQIPLSFAIRSDDESPAELLTELPPLRMPVLFSRVEKPTLIGDKLFVAAGVDNDFNLWVTDGTNEGTAEILTATGDHFDDISDLIQLGDSLFFVADSEESNSLWRMDATSRIAMRVSDDYLELVRKFDRSGLVRLGNEILFVAYGMNGSMELWRTDGKKTESILTLPGLPRILAAENKAYLLFDDQAWVTDGTRLGTQPISLSPAADRNSAVVFNNELLFVDEVGSQVVITNGMETERILAEGFEFIRQHTFSGGTIYHGTWFTTTAAHAYFGVRNGDMDELWVTDGTAENTRALRSFHSVAQLSAADNILYFAGDDEFGSELWRSDGTPAGTFRLTDINPGNSYSAHGTGSSRPTNITPIGDFLYFAADDVFHGAELYRLALEPTSAPIPGDSNHDGVFNSSDLVQVFQRGQYEDGVPNNSTFEDGDWNDDGEFDSSDLVFAFQQGGYVATAIPLTSVAVAVDSVFGIDDVWSRHSKRSSESALTESETHHVGAAQSTTTKR